MWLPVALLGYACLAVVSILDKYILSEEKVSPVKYVFFSTVFLSPLVLVFPFLVAPPNLFLWLAVVAAACSFVASLYTLYTAFLKIEVSHAGPFVGALIPLFIMALSRIFLGEIISSSQLLGIFLLSAGTLLISFQKNLPRGGRDWQIGMMWGMASALFFAVFHVCSKFVYSVNGFESGFLHIWGLIGAVGLAMLLLPEVKGTVFPRRRFVLSGFQKTLGRPKTKVELLTITLDKALGAVGVICIQFAVSIGSVTKVNALSGAQYGLLVLLVAFMSYFFPKIFWEKYGKGKLERELAAVFVIAVGLVFLVK